MAGTCVSVGLRAQHSGSRGMGRGQMHGRDYVARDRQLPETPVLGWKPTRHARQAGTASSSDRLVEQFVGICSHGAAVACSVRGITGFPECCSRASTTAERQDD